MHRAILTVWNHDFIRQLPMLPMQQLEDLFALSTLPAWPNAPGLNTLNSKLLNGSRLIPEFVCQSQISESAFSSTDSLDLSSTFSSTLSSEFYSGSYSQLYYEQIIQQKNVIPTRPNSWHDLFNGLIWLQFPQTKRLLNQQHAEDIEQFGLSPRTLRRNNLTHFDECGVIITYQCSGVFQQLIEDLKQHQWQSVLVHNRQHWGNEINSFIFGHANLEMLLQPFIGLTGKFLAVQVESDFSTLPYAEQMTLLDEILVKKIQQTNLFSAHKPLSPLPLLGIPNVWDANNDPEFYANTDYFRPKPGLKRNN